MDKRIIEIIKYGATFGILLLLFFGGGILLKGILGVDYPMMVVVSDSMVPTLGVGDYIFVTSIPDLYNIEAEPQPDGEIIVFLKPNSVDEYIVHRVIDKVTKNGQTFYITKGDHNLGADAWFLSPENIIGRVINRAPLLGYFSLFIKTFQGFAFVVILMALSFFIDYLMPKKKYPSMGKFNVFTLIPILVGPIVLAVLWFVRDGHIGYEFLAVGSWYLASFLMPLAFYDDDMAIMVWLYDLVLVMIPISCDIVYLTTGIMPSMWWYVQGSVVPINWLFMKVTPQFEQTFYLILRTTLPGVIIYILTLLAKRKGWEPFVSFHRLLRGISKEDITPPVSDPSTTDVNQQQL